MLRAAVVDEAGNINDGTVYNISFTVTAGPGRVVRGNVRLATHS